MTDKTHAALLKSSVKGMPRFVFKTLDGLLALDDCLDIEDGAMVIMRWMSTTPTTHGNGLRTFRRDARRYERTSETWMDLPVYQET